MNRSEKRTVFITGAGRGVGLALARACAARGDRVFAGVHGGAPDLGAGITSLVLDVADLTTVAACAQTIADTVGSVDVVFNNAAILGPLDQGTVGDLDYAAMARVFDVNALGPLRVCQTFWPLVAQGRERLFVNISSEAGSIAGCGRDGWFGYGMSKAALNMASAQFHNAIRPKGGRVLVIHPGWVRTNMQGKLDEAADLSPDESAAGILAVVASRGAESHTRPLYLQWNGEALSW
jgi:NAD(P)-dependent dehydrogenase (short-subunit alcohol dehydrogenase family)